MDVIAGLIREPRNCSSGHFHMSAVSVQVCVTSSIRGCCNQCNHSVKMDSSHSADTNASLRSTRLVSKEMLMFSSRGQQGGSIARAEWQNNYFSRLIPGASNCKGTPSGIICHQAPESPGGPGMHFGGGRHPLQAG